MELLRGVLGQASQGVDVGGTTYRLLSGVAHAAGNGLVQMIESNFLIGSSSSRRTWTIG